jgi:two-component system chemotaxis response regulator CheY
MVDDPGKVLVVDDSEEVRFLVCSILRSMGKDTLEAAHGAEALKLLDRDFRIRMVITDCEMPVMDGLELTRQIRADSRLEDLPVLMYTAASYDEVSIRADLAGVTKLLPKTISPGVLQDEVDRILHDTGPNHVWRALLINVPPDSATTIRSALSDAGFQVLQVSDEEQARSVLKSVESVDLAFVGRDMPGMKRIIMMHRLRTPQDFNLFRLVLLMRAVFADDAAKAGPVCVAGHLIDPVSHVQISGVLRRMGLNQIRSPR